MRDIMMPQEHGQNGDSTSLCHGFSFLAWFTPLMLVAMTRCCCIFQVALPVETASNICFLETYIQCILTLQRKSGARKPLPLAIMTSDDTHDKTLELLQKNSFFGAKPQQIHLIKQGRVPCFINPSGHLALDTHDPYACLLYTSPSPRDRQKSRMPSSA